jgi:hypothetical protein
MFDRLQRGRKKEGREGRKRRKEGRGPPSILNTQKGREKKKRTPIILLTCLVGVY